MELAEAAAAVEGRVRARVRVRGWGLEGRDQASGPMVAVRWRARRVMVSLGGGGSGIFFCCVCGGGEGGEEEKRGRYHKKQKKIKNL